MNDSETFTCAGCGLEPMTLPLYALHSYRCPGPGGNLVIAAALCLASAPYAREPEHDRAFYDEVVADTLRKSEEKRKAIRGNHYTELDERPESRPRPYTDLDESADFNPVFCWENYDEVFVPGLITLFSCPSLEKCKCPPRTEELVRYKREERLRRVRQYGNKEAKALWGI